MKPSGKFVQIWKIVSQLVSIHPANIYGWSRNVFFSDQDIFTCAFADKFPAHGPEFFVVVTLGGHKGLIIFYGRNQVRPAVYAHFKSST